MAHLRITIDIPEDSMFNWVAAFIQWKRWMPQGGEFGKAGKGESKNCVYTWKKEVIP